MKKILILLIALNCYFLNAQNKSHTITLEFNNNSLPEVFDKIEAATEYKFFYIQNWLDGTLISGKYNNVSLEKLLDGVLKETLLNFYITSDQRIILTQNSLINESLPIGFIDDTNDNIKKEIVKEVIKPKETEILPKLKTDNTETVASKLDVNTDAIELLKVGKESKIKKQDYKLSGYVKNEANGSPISGALLSVVNSDIKGATNDEGYYELILVPGEHILTIESMGFLKATKRVVMYDDGVLNVNLEVYTQNLEEVVIEVDKINNIRNAITGITKIEVAKIKNIPLVLGERDMLKVATTLPGISTAGEGSSGYNVRGGKEDQNLILLDDGVVYNPSHFFGIFSALNPFTTRDVTIYKGNVPAEFGGRLSSVFDIKTKNGNDEKLSGEVSIGPVTGNVMIETPIVKNTSSLLFGARGTYSDWILRSLKNESLNKSKASFYDVILKYNHKLNKTDNLSLTGYYSKDAYSITSDSLFSYSNRLLSLRWDKEINNKNKASLILANSEYKFNIGYNGESNTNFDLGYKVIETELKFKMKYFYNENHTLDYGVSSKLYNVTPGSLKPKGNASLINPLIIPEDRALESAVFVSDNFKINDKVSLLAGLRYSMFMGLGASVQREYMKDVPKNESTQIGTISYGKNEVYKSYGGPELRVSARYLISPTASIKAGYNHTYQYIHTLSNNTTLSPTDTWKLSDLNIKPQQSSQVSLGIFKNSENNLYEFSIEGYYKRIENLLDYKVGAELLLNEAIETEVIQGEGKAYGVELLLRKTKGKLNGWLSYSFSRSFIKLDSEFSEETVNNGAYFPSNFDKPHDLSIVANYKLTKRYSFSANFSYQTGRPVTYPVGNYMFNGIEYVAYSNRNEFRIPDYYRLDLGINIEGNHKLKKLAHSFWNISVYNVLGRNNPYSVFFVTESGEIKAYKSTIFSVPIPTITYNIKF